jgi:hypothetical protein
MNIAGRFRCFDIESEVDVEMGADGRMELID